MGRNLKRARAAVNGYAWLQLLMDGDPVEGRVEKVDEVARFRDYPLHTIKSHPTQREKVPHLAHSATIATRGGGGG
jgi:hypothetical protein